MQYADKLIEKYPDIITGYYNKGRALEAEKNYREAIVEYMLALESKIQCEYYLAETDEHLALIYSSLGQKEAAAGYAAKALDYPVAILDTGTFEGKNSETRSNKK